MNFSDDLNYYDCLYRKTNMKLKRSAKHLFQRLTRGYDDSDTWSLDTSLAKLILPRLRRFQEVRAGYPEGMTDEQWAKIIDEMIWAFEFYASEKQYASNDEKEWHRAKNGLHLFAEFYGSLWW